MKTGSKQLNGQYPVDGLTARPNDYFGYVLKSKKANSDTVPTYGPKVQLRDEKMSDNASVKTVTKGATINHPLSYDKGSSL